MIGVEIRDRSQVAEVRRRARETAADLGLGEVASERAALIATESATNLERHAVSGEILLIPHPHPQNPMLDLISVDHGPGMENLSACMEDGFSTAGGSGHGLGAIRRQSDRFDIFSTPGKGTVVVATVGRPSASTRPYHLEGISSPKPGETQCGDGWAIRYQADSAFLMVCDGLGHGPKAASAARAAEQTFTDGSDDLEATIWKLDEELKPTRGAAVALIDLPGREEPLRFLGVGNISGYLRSAGKEQRTVSFEGVVGRGDIRVRQMSYEVDDPFIAVFATDGLSMRWDLSSYRGLIGREPITIAAVLYRDHRRSRDDCTVIVARRSSL